MGFFSWQLEQIYVKSSVRRQTTSAYSFKIKERLRWILLNNTPCFVLKGDIRYLYPPLTDT